jgi:DNA-binding GntR family transcriptional regulator
VLLDLRRGAPVLTMERVAFDDRARAVECGSHVYDPRAHSFTVTLRSE